MTWNLEQLREDVTFLFGDEQHECLSPSLNSIVDRQTYARFHYQESKRILGEVLNDRDDQAILVDLIFGANRNAHHEFASRRKFAEAHVVAFLQSLHSLSDILAHAIYFALGLNLHKATRLPPKRVYLHKVQALLSAGEVSVRLQELINHEDYRYLADIVNCSKHRSVIQTPYSVDVTGCDTQPHGLKFAAFVYDDQAYPARWADPFMESEYNRQSALITCIGELLNDLVRSQGSLYDTNDSHRNQI
ncbi:hypothetical protein [Accumulibacter sp.]|uniref:hypothetical protein n=1 Tax=Accumulibacter sp. TaxID=2053492 RepID=UPI001A53F256|nr:hypothetical protein [Accumulibacter sp.]MBL8373938.1 hypothetical protein [Accumulibacter sp.]